MEYFYISRFTIKTPIKQHVYPKIDTMNFEEEANNLKEKYNAMLKQYKKHEKRKKEGGQLDSEFYTRDEELNHRISIFFKEYGKFIRTRKNSMGTFSVDDYVSYNKLNLMKMDGIYKDSISSTKKSFTVDEVFKDDDRQGYFKQGRHIQGGFYQAGNMDVRQGSLDNMQGGLDSKLGFLQGSLENRGFPIGGSPLDNKHGFMENKNLFPSSLDSKGSYNISKNGLNPMMDQKGSFTSPSTFNQPSFFIGDRVPVINMGDRNPGLSLGRMKMGNHSPTNLNYPLNNNIMNYSSRSKIEERSPNIHYNNSPTNINYNKSPTNINYNKSPNFNQSPNFNKPSIGLNYNYSTLNNINSSSNYINQNKMINTRKMESPSFMKNMNPNIMYNMSNKYYNTRINSSYTRQNTQFIQNTYMHNSSFMQGRPGYMHPIKNEGFGMETPQNHPTSFYDKYVKNQISINDFIKSKKIKTDHTEVKPIILNKCIVANKKVDILYKEKDTMNLSDDPDRKIIEDLLINKPVDQKTKDLLYEICDNFVEHVVLSVGELTREKKKIEKKDLEFIFKMEFGMETPE
ncbi:hypothetical protein P3W45_000369 [Vairimorpha bombi]|jgi:hypothetical protein